jgi:hypothetical protein
MVKDFLKAHKGKIAAAAGVVVFIAIGLIVGDVSLGQVKDCVFSFDLQSAACLLISGNP